MALAHAGAAEGTAVLAGAQRAGRGRLGRTWFSPPGAGLYLSVDRAAAGRRAGTGVADAGRRRRGRRRRFEAATGLAIELKWPNDLVTGRPWRKLGGLLCESAGSGAFVDAVVVGIGVNVRPAAYPPDDRRPRDVARSRARPDVDRARLLRRDPRLDRRRHRTAVGGRPPVDL